MEDINYYKEALDILKRHTGAFEGIDEADYTAIERINRRLYLRARAEGSATCRLYQIAQEVFSLHRMGFGRVVPSMRPFAARSLEEMRQYNASLS